MKQTILAALLAVTSGVAAAAAQNYEIDPTHTYAGYEVNHMGLSLQRGGFGQIGGKVVLDPDAKAGSVDVTIDASSLNTDLPARDKHLKSADFFNVAKYPTLSFKSSTLRFAGDRLDTVDGQLTLLGVTRPVTLKVVHFARAKNPMTGKDSYGVNAEGVIRRSDFGMKTYLPAIGDEVKLRIALEAVKAD